MGDPQINVKNLKSYINVKMILKLVVVKYVFVARIFFE